jgi:hypothetical protein
MFPTYRLPSFLDYLSDHYYQLYKKYVGRLTELFPSSQPVDNLVIAEDDSTSEEEDQFLLQLWKKYIG